MAMPGMITVLDYIEVLNFEMNSKWTGAYKRNFMCESHKTIKIKKARIY